MKHIALIPFVAEFTLDFSRWTLGIFVYIDDSKEIASALLHIGNDPEHGFSFDCCFLQAIQTYLDKP